MNDTDNMTDDIEWCQVQSNRSGKGEHATPVLHGHRQEFSDSQWTVQRRWQGLLLKWSSSEMREGIKQTTTFWLEKDTTAEHHHRDYQSFVQV